MDRATYIEHLRDRLRDNVCEIFDGEYSQDAEKRTELTGRVDNATTIGELVAVMQDLSWDINSALYVAISCAVEGVNAEDFCAVPNRDWDT